MRANRRPRKQQSASSPSARKRSLPAPSAAAMPPPSPLNRCDTTVHRTRWKSGVRREQEAASAAGGPGFYHPPNPLPFPSPSP